MDEPIELMRLGPPPFKRPTLAELEDAMIASIDMMNDEDIKQALVEDGIDMKPALAKLHAMIEAKKAEIAKNA